MDEKVISDLVAHSEIMRLIYLYPRGVDRLDHELLLSIGHPTATVEFTGMFKGSWADYIDWLMGAHVAMLYNRHTIGNVLLEIDGTSAVSETTATASLIVSRDDGDVEDRITHARYLDTWCKDDGRWWLASRLTLRDRRTVNILTKEELAATITYSHAPDIGRADPSFTHLKQSHRA